jgi:hypothetical protein
MSSRLIMVSLGQAFVRHDGATWVDLGSLGSGHRPGQRTASMLAIGLVNSSAEPITAETTP